MSPLDRLMYFELEVSILDAGLLCLEIDEELISCELTDLRFEIEKITK